MLPWLLLQPGQPDPLDDVAPSLADIGWSLASHHTSPPAGRAFGAIPDTVVSMSGYQDLDSLFTWSSFDVTALLPVGWQQELVDLAQRASTHRQIVPPHPTSREAVDVTSVAVQGVSAATLRDEAPWLSELYENEFRHLAQRCSAEEVVVAKGKRHTVVLNVQSGVGMRYECHVDTNPVQGMLYVTSHLSGSGGELVVANRLDAHSVAEIEADCSTIYPIAGHFLVFDGRSHPHFIRSLTATGGLRVAAAMNYYTPSSPEEQRPSDLDDYLVGEPVS